MTAKLTKTQIQALRYLDNLAASRLVRSSGHGVFSPSPKTWDKLKELGLTEMGPKNEWGGAQTQLSQAGREYLEALAPDAGADFLA